MPSADRGGTRVRAATSADAEAIATLTAAAFSPDPPGPVGRWHDDPRTLRRVVERESDGAVLATAQLRLADQWWGGSRVAAAALGGVAVDLTARGRGVGAQLLTDAFAVAREAGAAVVALVPSTHGFYRRVGCGIAGRRSVFAVPAHQLGSLPRDRSLTHRAATAADLADVTELVAARSARGNGGLEHDPAPGGSRQFVTEREGRVVGWCALGRRPADTGLYTVTVLDLVAADPDAELSIWRDLVADEPSAHAVHTLVPAGSLLEHRLPRQSAPVENATWMIGLLDVPAALSARGYPAGVRARITFDVDGDRTTLEVSDGTGTAATGEGPVLAVGAPDLASIYAGHLDPVLALQAGLVQAEPATAQLVRTLFAGPPAVLDRPF